VPDAEAPRQLGARIPAAALIERILVEIERNNDAEPWPKSFKRGGCECLCHHLMRLNPGEGCADPSCEIDTPCGRLRVDLKHGVPLACVSLVPGECEGFTFGDPIDACGPRRLVKRNDLLFDLVRGCDLTRIGLIGWLDWHRNESPIPFDELSRGMGPEGTHQPEYLTEKFWVLFTGPVQARTLRVDCFTMTVVGPEREGCWWQTQRVPIIRLEPITLRNDPAHLVRGARLVVDGGWVEDALRGRGSVFRENTWIEIAIHGDFILDCNGQPVDANAIGLHGVVSGNGTPGDTFHSRFPVAARIDRPAGRDTTTTGA
jgi:hypothetical protein